MPPSETDNSRPVTNAALLLIDVVTDFEFEGGDRLLKHTIPAASKLAALKKRAKAARVPTIYVNDNFGRWQEDFRTMAEHHMRPEAKGQKVVTLLRPEPDDYYVLKPHRSAFYSTTLELLLRNLKTRTLIITGVTTDICILFSANDGYMRGFDLTVPRDCVAAVEQKYTRQAIEFIERVLKADTRPSSEIAFRNKSKR